MQDRGTNKFCLKRILFWQSRWSTNFLSKPTLSLRVTVVSYFPTLHNEPKSTTYVNNFLFSYNGRKQNICFAVAVSAASTTECCYRVVPPFLNDSQPKTEQSFHILHFRVVNWRTRAHPSITAKTVCPECGRGHVHITSPHPGQLQKGEAAPSSSGINQISIPKLKAQIASFPRR